MKHNLLHSKGVDYSIVYRSKQKVTNFYLLQFQSSLRRTFLDFDSILWFENQNFAATLEILNLIMSGRTLWTWAHLPTNVEDNMDKSWLHEGDAVENVHRLKISKHENIPAGNLRSSCFLIWPPLVSQMFSDISPSSLFVFYKGWCRTN